MVVPNVNTVISQTVPKHPRPQFHVVDGVLCHGDCADCGDPVPVSESFLRVKNGEYVCEACANLRCVRCAGPNGIIADGADEPICQDCRNAKRRLMDETVADANFLFYADSSADALQINIDADASSTRNEMDPGHPVGSVLVPSNKTDIVADSRDHLEFPFDDEAVGDLKAQPNHHRDSLRIFQGEPQSERLFATSVTTARPETPRSVQSHQVLTGRPSRPHEFPAAIAAVPRVFAELMKRNDNRGVAALTDKLNGRDLVQGESRAMFDSHSDHSTVAFTSFSHDEAEVK